MKRKYILIVTLIASLFIVIGCQAERPTPTPTATATVEKATVVPPATLDDDALPVLGTRVELSDDEWKSRLSPEEYRVLRTAGTERAFTGDLLTNKEKGVYTCAGCGAPLFSSEHKFKSGTGWPSFYTTIEEGRVGRHEDRSLGMTRIEVVCDHCEGHLGHIFNDGPEPTGLRYCINAVSMNFVPQAEWDAKYGGKMSDNKPSEAAAVEKAAEPVGEGMKKQE